MTSEELRQKYLNFYKEKGHTIIPSAPLIPENDPSALFTSAGMHPLIPYLLGQPHPSGKRLVDVQKCLRTGDIDEVGDICHHTFFEMLGNWSLGEYFKKEAIEWSYQFLITKEGLNVSKDNIAISVFAGDSDAPFDKETYNLWLEQGVPKERIVMLPKKDNWWGPVGQTGPCGPDTEMFVWTGTEPTPLNFDPKDPQWVEIWNDVFMEYNQNSQGKFEKLLQKNVDTGMGLERALAVANHFEDDYRTELFWPVIQEIEKKSNKLYDDFQKEFRIIADHIRASVFLIDDGIEPSNKERGYVLRRLIRRSSLQLTKLEILNIVSATTELSQVIIDIMGSIYPRLKTNQNNIFRVLDREVARFNLTLDKGLKEFNKLSQISGKDAFDLFQTFGFPWELTVELALEKGIKVNKEEFEKEFEKHRELSKTASSGMFKGGLADSSEITTKYHTATHLLHAALRQVLGNTVQQKGSNITAERLRFDFSQPEKLSAEQIKEIENIVNQKIQEGLSVNSEVMDKEEALKSGALGFFTEKYGDRVTVYSIGNPSSDSGHSTLRDETSGSDSKRSPFSREICGGPHVKNTSQLGNFKITKEESAGSGIRRIYAVLS